MNLTPKNRATWIKETLQQAFAPSYLEVIDQGWQHIGHAEEGAGHFKVCIAAKAFEDCELVDCHRRIYAALGDAVGNTIHALQIEIQ